jgi:hypothetical protein
LTGPAAATSRLEQLPRFLEQARGSIEPDRVPKIHAETAIKQNPGLSSIIEAMIVPNMDALPTAQQARLNAAIETAKDALANHQTWLEEELLPRANGDFRIGAELYDVKLAFALNSPLSRKEITARAEQEYEAVRNKMYEVAKEVYAGQHPFTALFPTPPTNPTSRRSFGPLLKRPTENFRRGMASSKLRNSTCSRQAILSSSTTSSRCPRSPSKLSSCPSFGVAWLLRISIRRGRSTRISPRSTP